VRSSVEAESAVGDGVGLAMGSSARALSSAESSRTQQAQNSSEPLEGASKRLSVAQVWTQLISLTLTHYGIWLMLMVLSHKVGETMMRKMLMPFLVDCGLRQIEVGWITTLTNLGSIGGTLYGGHLVTSMGPKRALLSSFEVRSLSMLVLACVLFLFQSQSIELEFAAATSSSNESFLSFFSLMASSPVHSLLLLALLWFWVCAGSIGVVMCAFLMTFVHSSSVATSHYTFLQCLDEVSRPIGAVLSGFVAETVGYSRLFFISVAISVVPLLLIRFEPRSHKDKKLISN